MKLKIYILIAFLFTACQTDPAAQKKVTIPETFTQKVLIELFNGAWCGFSPDGDLMVKEISDFVPSGRYDYVQYHIRDQMTIVDDTEIKSKYMNSIGIPSAMVNRLDGKPMNRYTEFVPYPSYNPQKNNAWLISTLSFLDQDAACGLAIDARERKGNIVKLKVSLGIGPNGMSTNPHYLTVLTYEKEMSGSGTGWDYVNYMSKSSNAHLGPEHPHYNDPNPIKNYVHTNAVRAVLSNNPLGDALEASSLSSGAYTEFNYELDISNFGEDLKFVAIVHEQKDEVFNPVLAIRNVQFVDLESFQDFD
jgi:hypothetical protein